MKKKIVQLFVLLVLITATACNSEKGAQENGKDQNTVSQSKKDKSVPGLSQADSIINHIWISSLLISDSEAQIDIQNFQKKLKNEGAIKSFTIRAEDLLAAMNIDITKNVDTSYMFRHMRVYPAYNETNGEYKLYFYPVKGADLRATPRKIGGFDWVFNQQGTRISPKSSTNFKSGNGVGYGLDLVTPCPQVCPDGEGN